MWQGVCETGVTARISVTAWSHTGLRLRRPTTAGSVPGDPLIIVGLQVASSKLKKFCLPCSLPTRGTYKPNSGGTGPQLAYILPGASPKSSDREKERHVLSNAESDLLEVCVCVFASEYPSAMSQQDELRSTTTSIQP